MAASPGIKTVPLFFLIESILSFPLANHPNAPQDSQTLGALENQDTYCSSFYEGYSVVQEDDKINILRTDPFF